MDNSVISSHYEILAKHYPTVNATQLGLVVLMLGALRSTMGHEGAEGTVTNYIHKEILSDDVKECIEFLEREILSVKKSRIDIDYWKRGNVGAFRED